MDISIEDFQGLKNMSVESLLFQIGNGGVQVRTACVKVHIELLKRRRAF
jgi:hypothetical protein